jgi:hypothetical protein
VAVLLALGSGFAWADSAAREATQLVEQATFAIDVAAPALLQRSTQAELQCRRSRSHV